MRKPDIEALANHVGEKDGPGDLRATLNLMAIFCQSGSLDELTPFGTEVARAMAEILQAVGPVISIQQAARNIDLVRRIKREVLDRGSHEQAYVAFTSTENLGTERLRQIRRGKFADTSLAEFIHAALNGLNISPKQLTAAQTRIAKVHGRLLADTKTGAETRALLELKGWRELGKSILHEEIYGSVESLIGQGMKPGNAIEAVSKLTGETPGNVKKIFQRMKSNHRRDIEVAAQAAGVRPFDIENRDKTTP